MSNLVLLCIHHVTEKKAYSFDYDQNKMLTKKRLPVSVLFVDLHVMSPFIDIRGGT